MKKALIFLSLFIAANAFTEGGNLKFGVTPGNPNTRDSLQIFTGYLTEKTGKKFELVVAEPDELLTMLANGEVSLADLSSSVYATAASLYGDKIKYVATVAARNEKGQLVPYYKGVFFTLKDKPYKSMLDLKKGSFAFVSKTSTSGYLYPLAMLNQMGINQDTFFGSVSFVGDHAKVFEGLKSGFLDAGVSNYDAYQRARTMYGDIFKVIGETAEIPSGAIVAASSVDDGIVKKLEDALLRVKETDPVVNYPGFLYKGFIKKGGGFYDFIKGLLKQSLYMPAHPYP